MGQVHYVTDGTGPPIVLLHQSPWFGVQYAKVQPLIAAAGFQAIAIDTPGFGRSDLPDHPPSAEEYADNVVLVLDHLKLDRAIVVGHHTGASLAAAFAARHPGRTRGLIMHGLPLYTAEERADRIKTQLHPDTDVYADGSHFAERWRRLQEQFAKGATPESIQWSVLAFLLAGKTEWYGHRAAFSFDMEAALRAVKAPTLVMSNTGDTIHAGAARARVMRPDFGYHEFAGGNSHMMYDDPQPWAAAVIAFARGLG
jgi:pimeloyl-ACP methyl ester carboxylesterase